MWVVLPVAVRTALVEAGLGVNRASSKRAHTMRRGRRRRPKLVCYEGADGRIRVRQAFVNGRRTLPEKHSSAWGWAMRARKGGYERQRRCRQLGIHPTAQATAARLARRKRVGLRDQPSIANGTNQDRYRIRTAADVTYASYVRFGR